ncbi:MAG: paraquat-inducible protein A [Micropepsaceae bacterium]
MPTEAAAARRGAPTALLWALLTLAVALLVIAWTFPLLTVQVTARLPSYVPEPLQSFTILDETRSVITMVQRLWETNYILIAVLILVFGVALPIVKNLGVALLLASPSGSRGARAARLLQFMGRFAMVDIFAISIIVSVMAASTIGQGDNPGPAVIQTVTTLQSGFYLFIGYVLASFVVDVLLAIRHRALSP